MRNRRNGSPTKGRTYRGALASFVAEAAVSDTDDCILWPFTVNPRTGYGAIKFEGRMCTAHRAVLMLATGERPPRSIHAAHAPVICHNRACVNPRHLRWVSQEGNESDKEIDGTKIIGSRSPNAILSDEQVRAIRRDARSAAAIAREMGVGRHLVWNVKTYRRYRDVV